MSKLRVIVFVGVLLVLVLMLTGYRPGPVQSPELIANFKALLEPGVWHGWNMGPSSNPGAYLVDVTPLSASKDGAYVERALVQPEYDGTEWNDVLRIMFPDGFKPQKVNVRVYRIEDLPVRAEFDTILEPGVWHGWGLGPCEQDQGYLVVVTPLEDSVEGAYIERALVQPEFDGHNWNDVARVMIPEWMPQIHVQIRIYGVKDLPVVAEFDTTLEPGVWQGYYVERSKARQAYIIETSPTIAGGDGAHVQRAIIQPEFNGKKWNDILRLMIPETDPALDVNVRVYAWR
jgi:uncharacterized protein YceK